jgi:hypothetical protein
MGSSFLDRFELIINFESVDNKATTYRIQAVFEGDTPQNATAYTTTPNGTSYPLCTTMQTVYWPSLNTAALTVEPPSTTATADSESTATEQQESTKVEIPPGKTPEQLEQEAKDKGWLSIKHEFTWWYPWYRCHLMLDVDLPQGHLHIDYGWTALPFGQTFKANEVIAYIFNDMTANIAWDVIESFFVGLFIQHAAALVLGRTLIGTVIAIGAYLAYSLLNVIKLYRDSGDNPNAWLAASIASTISGTFGLFESKLKGLIDFLTAVSRQVRGKISHIMNSFWARGLNFFNITVIAFSLIDFALTVFYLTQYLAVI